ncbi:MAG: tetratricopeptide repeat protein [Armatimonadota bacterium]
MVAYVGRSAVAAYYLHSGTVYLGLQKYRKAIENFTKAIRLNPNNAKAYALRGSAYIQEYQLDRAIKDYTKAIQLNPIFALAYSSRGDAYRMKDEYSRAINDYSMAILLDPNNCGARYGYDLAYEMLIRCIRRPVIMNTKKVPLITPVR